VTWEVNLGLDGRVDVQLSFDRTLPQLDTVVVSADGSCSRRSVDGFVCRRRSAGGRGVFMDYNDIDDKGRVRLSDDHGHDWTFDVGDAFLVPSGFQGWWETLEPAQKFYAIYEPPAAQN